MAMHCPHCLLHPGWEHSVFIQEEPIYFSVNEQTFCYYQERPFQAQRQESTNMAPTLLGDPSRGNAYFNSAEAQRQSTNLLCHANDATES